MSKVRAHSHREKRIAQQSQPYMVKGEREGVAIQQNGGVCAGYNITRVCALFSRWNKQQQKKKLKSTRTHIYIQRKTSLSLWFMLCACS